MSAPWADLAEGAEMSEFTDKPLRVNDFVRYQGASGDMNPIHHEEAYAQAAGFPSVFAVGMLGAGIAAGKVAEWLGPEGLRRFKVQFREQAWPGDVHTYSARVTNRREEEGRRLVDVEFEVVRQTGGVHLKGEAGCELGPES